MTKLTIENLGFAFVLEGKPVALLGVASGRSGARKSLQQLRGVCAHVGAISLPGSISIAGVHQAFDEDGTCLNEDIRQTLNSLADNITTYIDKFICPGLILEAQIREREEEDEPWTSSL